MGSSGTGIDYIKRDRESMYNELVVKDKKYGERNKNLLNTIAQNVFKKDYKSLDKEEVRSMFTYIDTEFGDRNGKIEDYELYYVEKKINKKKPSVINGMRAYGQAFKNKLEPVITNRYKDEKNDATTKSDLNEIFKNFVKSQNLQYPQDAKEAFILTVADMRLNTEKDSKNLIEIGSEIQDRDIEKAKKYIKQMEKGDLSKNAENFKEKFYSIYKAMKHTNETTPGESNTEQLSTKFVTPEKSIPSISKTDGNINVNSMLSPTTIASASNLQTAVVTSPITNVTTVSTNNKESHKPVFGVIRKHFNVANSDGTYPCHSVWNLVKEHIAKKNNIPLNKVKQIDIQNGVKLINKDQRNKDIIEKRGGIDSRLFQPGDEICLSALDE